MDFNLKKGDMVLANFDLLEINSRENSLTWAKPLPRGPVFDSMVGRKNLACFLLHAIKLSLDLFLITNLLICICRINVILPEHGIL